MNAHEEPVYKYTNSSLPVSESVRRNSIIIPLYNGMTIEDIATVIQGVKTVVLKNTHS
jgi:dTDP-4-amino-4,6-dideoxygalactose transaminase